MIYHGKNNSLELQKLCSCSQNIIPKFVFVAITSNFNMQYPKKSLKNIYPLAQMTSAREKTIPPVNFLKMDNLKTHM